MAGVRIAVTAAVAASLLCGPLCFGAAPAATTPPDDRAAAEAALAALRGSWLGEIDQLTSLARSLAMAEDCADFVVRPNLPYVYDNFGREQLAAARIYTVLIVNGARRPIFWRRVEGGRHAGFADATAFLAELPRLPRTAPVGEPGFAGAVQLPSGAALVVAMPIRAAAGARGASAWLVVARRLDAQQWRRYAELAHVDATVVDRSGWPSDVREALDQPLTPVIRIGSSDVRGYLSVSDVSGRSFRAFALAVPRQSLVAAGGAAGGSRDIADWLPLMAVVACGAGVTPIVLRRRNRATASAKRSAAPAGPPAAPPPDPVPEGVDMPPPREPPALAPGAPDTSVAVGATSCDEVPSTEPAALVRRDGPRDAATLTDSSTARRERLRAALVAIDIAFRYQPQVDLLTGRVSGVEALVFLKGATDDRVPTSLVTQLEAAGLGLPLAERWLQDICSERRRWRRQIGQQFPIGMPVSLRTLEDPGFLPLVLETLGAYELPPHLLELEVPDSALAGNAAVARVLAAASEAGVLIAVDEFNGARTSLHSLAVLPITKLRVDSGLIGAIGGGTRSARLFDAIVGAARALEIPVCATRVDTQELLIATERRGCGAAQGIALGRPSDGEQFLALVCGSGVDTASLPMAQVQEGLRRAAESAAA